MCCRLLIDRGLGRDDNLDKLKSYDIYRNLYENMSPGTQIIPILSCGTEIPHASTKWHGRPRLLVLSGCALKLAEALGSSPGWVRCLSLSFAYTVTKLLRYCHDFAESNVKQYHPHTKWHCVRDRTFSAYSNAFLRLYYNNSSCIVLSYGNLIYKRWYELDYYYKCRSHTGIHGWYNKKIPALQLSMVSPLFQTCWRGVGPN